jgi:hypothetical protein
MSGGGLAAYTHAVIPTPHLPLFPQAMDRESLHLIT